MLFYNDQSQLIGDARLICVDPVFAMEQKEKTKM